MHQLLIAHIQHAINIGDEEQQFITQIFKEKHAAKNDYFLREGDVSKEVGFIINGLVRYFVRKDDGEEMIYDFGREENFMCNYESFLDHSPSQKNIQFIEDTTWLAVSFNDLQLFYKKVKEGEKFGRIICEQIFVDALHKITSLYTHTPLQRYRQFLDAYTNLQQRIPQYYIASFVGVQPPSLSRIRKKLAAS